MKQSKVRAENEQRVAELPTTRLEEGFDENGNPTLTAIFPRKGGGEPHRIDITLLLEFPGLTDLFAQGFLAWGRGKTNGTRLERVKQLRYWFVFLANFDQRFITPARVQEDVLAGFNQWLHTRTKKNGQPLHPNTIRKALESVRTTLRTISAGESIAARVPAGPRGAIRKTTPTEGISWPILMAIWKAAEKETFALRDRWVRGQTLLTQGRRLWAQGHRLVPNPGKQERDSAESTSDANLALCLAMIDAAFPSVVPELASIQSTNLSMGNSVKYAFGRDEITGYLYASSRDLVPLVLLLGFATAFNPDTLLSLEWKNVDREVDRLGTAAVRICAEEAVEGYTEGSVAPDQEEEPLLSIQGVKPRASRMLRRLLDPTASDPSQASLSLVLDLLRDLTDRIRPELLPDHQDRLFIYVASKNYSGPKGYGRTRDSPSGDNVWCRSLRNFCKDHDLPKFSLKQIRFTLLDYVQLVNRGSLEASRQVGNHEGRITTWTHYTSGLMRRLLQEGTGEILLTRERWIDTGGRIDPRTTPIGSDKSSASPGFDCLDPFDSPRPNQNKGRLCRAYGECPACPLVAVKPFNPTAVMYWEALQRAIHRSVSTMTAPMWMERWAPVAADLKALIVLVPESVLVESRRFRVELPNVG
ncbi:hypothetical protein [Thiobacillus denitrificans]|uniref:hypothetical protein n=1 Tax=Thiobacillus denitrificans TaxID=36861 RepID=UPI0012FA36DC|nr:hypothetical protein [Thiobacillus denitrificans]